MTFSRIAAIVAGLSLPAKAFAATAVAAAAVGGAAVTLPPATPDAASTGLENASENAGFEVPTHGQPAADAELDASVEEDAVEAQDEHENNGLDDAVRAEEPQDRSDVGKARAAENRAAAEERSGAAGDARADAEARAAAEERRDQAGDDAAGTTADDADDADDDADTEDTDAEDTEETEEDQSSTGTERSGEGRARAGDASGR